MIKTSDDIRILLEEVKLEDCQPCLAFTGYVEEEVYNSLIFYEDSKFRLVEMNGYDESAEGNIIEDEELVNYLFEHKDDLNELLKNFGEMEWKEKVKNKRHLILLK